MRQGADTRVLGWALVGLVFLAILLFGATRLPWDALRFDLGSVFAALVLALAGIALLRLPPEERPSRAWVLALAALPLWLGFQLIPLPEGLRGLLGPEGTAWLAELWPGPSHDLAGEPLVAGEAPSWSPLSLDVTASREFLFRVVAAGLLFLAAGALFPRGSERHRRLLLAVSLFGGAEAIYGIIEWASRVPQIFFYERTAYVDCATGTLINRNHFAMLLYLSLGCTLSLLVRRRAERAAGEAGERDLALRVGLSALVAVQLAAILLSQSRAGIAGALLVLLPSLPLLFRGNRATRVVALATAAMVAVPAVLVVGPAILERTEVVSNEWTSDGGRGAVLRTSRSLVSDFALTGSGGATFERVFARRRPPAIVGAYNYAHNDYLQLLIEAGVLGLLFALLPVLLLATHLLRSLRAGEDDARLPWPLLLALLAVLLHEVVDFGLQIPALAFLVALLAGSLLRLPRGRTAVRPAQIAAVAGLVLVLPALLQGVAAWPGLENRLPWPELPSAHRAEAQQAFRSYRTAGDTEELDRAIGHAARAQELRPLSPYLPIYHAGYLRTAISRGVLLGEDADRARSELERLLGRARALDPWNSHSRSRLLALALAGGDLPGALDDAVASGRARIELAQRALDRLERGGLPQLLIIDALKEEPLFLRELLARAQRARDDEALARLAPRDIEPSLGRCRAGGYVAGALRRRWNEAAEPFLQRCLELEAVVQDPRLVAHLETHIGWDRYWLGDIDGAAEKAAELSRPFARHWLLYNIAQKRAEWPAVVRHGHALLREEASRDDPWPTRLHLGLGEAYARQGKQRLAIRQYERVVRRDPEHELATKMLRRLRRGDNPFPR